MPWWAPGQSWLTTSGEWSRLSGLACPSAQHRAFTREGCREHLPQELVPALGPVLETIASLTTHIREYERRLESIAKDSYPETRLLRQVHGVGALSALAFVLTLEDPSRFAKRPASRALPGAGAWCRAVGQKRSPKAHLQARKRDDQKVFGQLRPLRRPRALRRGLRSTAPWGEDCTKRRR